MGQAWLNIIQLILLNFKGNTLPSYFIYEETEEQRIIVISRGLRLSNYLEQRFTLSTTHLKAFAHFSR